MPIPPEFSFSQNNLQDFLDCPRRFELRYLLHRAWPAIQSEPVIEHERQIQRGERFHQLIHQHQLGLPAEQVGAQAKDDLLSLWWVDYLDYVGHLPPSDRFPEYTLRAPFGRFQIVAKFDLIAFQPDGRAIIVDWKTGFRKPSRSIIRQRVQTRLYPLLLVEAAHHLNHGRQLHPDQIEMIYWFTADPLHPEHFIYSTERYEKDKRFIHGLIEHAERYATHLFPLTSDERFCQFCTYRSLCQRGEQGASLDQVDIEPPNRFNINLDLDQIAEIEY